MKSIACIVLLFISVLICHKASGQHPTELSPGYYIVVAAYAPSRENVAQNYTDVLNRRGYKAAYGFNSGRNFFFVYLKFFDNLKESLKDMQRTRKMSEDFSDAWVRVIPGDIAPVTPVVKQPEKAEEPPKEVAKVETVTEEKKESTVVDTAVIVAGSQDSVQVTDNPEIKQYEKMTLGNTEVFLSLYNATNNRIVEGAVTVVDTERTKFIQEVKGNEYLLLPDPKSKSGQLTLICEAFGYRKIQHELNYPLPLADTVKPYIDLMGTTIVVNFDLIRYQRGDIATLFHVYFYNDAALMLPESKYELNSLLQMMQEDPKYRIRLHGHTNGNYHGRIITMGDDKNIFSLDGSKSTVGTAKDLSSKRAGVIKEFLIENGIADSRIEIKSWGGKRPIYDKHGANAKKNVRVEVEILDN